MKGAESVSQKTLTLKKTLFMNHFRFWKEQCEHCPETRVEMAKQQQKREQGIDKVKTEKPKRRMFADCGRPFSFNEPKLEFRFDDRDHEYVLDLHLYR